MRSHFLCAAGLLFSVGFVSAGSALHPQAKPPAEEMNSGAHLFREFCASCHGESGKGDGPVADIARGRPPDLTGLSERNGGAFPRALVLSSLDGSRPLPAHTAPGMPKWLDVLRQIERGNERRAQQHLEAIVTHVETLQRN